MIKYINIKIFVIVFYLIFCKSFALENKIVLKVNNEIITTLDIFDEINELKFFNKNFSMVDEKEIYQIALQSILKHEIRKTEILKNFNNFKVINENYLNDLIKENYKKLGFDNLTDFKDNLKKNEVNFVRFKEKLEINFLWSQIIYTKYFNKVVINEKKLKDQINNMKNSSKLFNLNEIVYQAQNLKDVDTVYNIIKNDITKLGFEAAATKHSLSDTSSAGGNIGWVDENALNKQILNELETIPLKSITKPIRISGGFLILQKLEEKEIIKNYNPDDELNKLIKFETEQQLSSFSNIHFNKIKNDLRINAP
jgi:peptidyl-prolyl cis-trans isomerase SurA